MNIELSSASHACSTDSATAAAALVRATRRARLLSAALALSAVTGHAGLPPALYDLASLGGNVGSTINGPGLAAHAGSAVAGNCDVNGDGISDLIVGAPFAGAVGGGEVFVMYGTAAGLPPPASMNDADVTIVGEQDGDMLGFAVVCAGDVNGDGYDDLLLTAPGTASAGYAYLIYGGTSLPASLPLTSLTGSQGMRIPGVVANEQFGHAAAAGDVNGDGLSDIAVTAPGANGGSSNTGQGFVIFGSTTLPSTFDLNGLNGSNGFSVSATDLFIASGDSIAVGDLNGDGRGDVAIGARSAFPNGLSSGGAVYVVYGHGGSFPAEIQVGNLDGSNGFAIEASIAGSWVGTSVGFVSDFNGDGREDIVIGAPSTSTGTLTGRGYVVFGAAAFPPHFSLGSFDGTNGVVLSSPTVGDGTGASIAGIPDLNGDGIGEVVLGAPSADLGAADAGGGYVVYGRRRGWTTANLDLSTLNGASGFRIQGAAQADGAGTAVSSAGDVNRDGLHDVMIGAPLADVANSTNVGRVYVIRGNDLIFADGFDGTP